TLEAFTGEHVLISGPARSGKSTMLAAIHQMLIQQYPGIDILVSAPRRSPLGQLLPEVMPPDQLLNRVAEKGGSPEPCIIMIDDAHMIADESQVLTQALNSPESPFLFIVSGRNNDLRSLYSHWTGKIRKSRLGVLLVPDTDYDGDLLGVRLPRHPRVTMSEARGYGCQNGTATLIQGVTASVRSLR
ncbi:MAG: ATP-binding protein, partial [Cutibacterium granulosum]|nr:ATP-binding protein [Cutibacterium granulosum]